MSNGEPAMMRDARQEAGLLAPRQPTTVRLTDMRAYLDPRHTRTASLAPGSVDVAGARTSAIEDARMDCRSYILRHTAVRLR